MLLPLKYVVTELAPQDSVSGNSKDPSACEPLMRPLKLSVKHWTAGAAARPTARSIAEIIVCPDRQMNGGQICQSVRLNWGTWRHAPTCSVGRQNAGPVDRTAEGVLPVISKLAKPLYCIGDLGTSGTQGMVLVEDEASVRATHKSMHNVCTILPTAMLTFRD